jgi:hypothetical protein
MDARRRRCLARRSASGVCRRRGLRNAAAARGRGRRERQTAGAGGPCGQEALGTHQVVLAFPLSRLLCRVLKFPSNCAKSWRMPSRFNGQTVAFPRRGVVRRLRSSVRDGNVAGRVRGGHSRRRFRGDGERAQPRQALCDAGPMWRRSDGSVRCARRFSSDVRDGGFC